MSKVISTCFVYPSIKYNNGAIQVFRDKCPLSILFSLSQGYVSVSKAVLVTQFAHSRRHMLFPDVATILWQHLKDERSRLYLPSIRYNNEATQIFRNKCPLSILSSLSQGYVLVSEQSSLRNLYTVPDICSSAIPFPRIFRCKE